MTKLPHTEIVIATAERRAALFALVAGLLLMAVKFAAYYLTGSAAIFSDALESIVNILGGAFALYAVIVAHHPADEEHPYGHGKIEFLSAGFEGGMMALGAVIIAAESVDRFVRGVPITSINSGIWLMAIATLVNGALGIFLIQRGKKFGSIALEADGRHLLSDAVTSTAVAVALLLVVATHRAWIDSLAAMFIAIYLGFTSRGLLRKSTAGLMDAQDHADDKMLRGILDSHLAPAGKPPNICSYHKLRHRHSGRYHWVDFHLMVPHDWDIAQGHRVASAIEFEIESALGEGNATAHVEPCVDEKCPACQKNTRVVG